MTHEDFEEFWTSARVDKEFLKFDRVEVKLAQRPDLHAFLLMDQILSGTGDVVTAAEHDKIYLYPEIDALREVITAEQILELSRCGVLYDEEVDSLAMFV